MITGSQIRASRALLKWSAAELATAAGMERSAIHRMERSDGIPEAKALSVYAVEIALTRAGLVFLDGEYSGDGGFGVRFSEKRPLR